MPKIVAVQATEKKPAAEVAALAKLDPILPKPPFTWICVAQSGSGKTVTFLNLVGRSAFYRDYYARKGARIFVMSPTIHNDPTCGRFQEWKNAVCVDHFSPALIQDFMDSTKEAAEEGEPIPPSLFIIDDCAFDVRHPVFERFVKQSRHYNASILVSSQQVTGLGPSVRKNAHAVSLWRLKPEDMKAAHKAFAPSEKFWGWLAEATGYGEDEVDPSKKYAFLTLDIRNRRALASLERVIGEW